MVCLDSLKVAVEVNDFYFRFLELTQLLCCKKLIRGYYGISDNYIQNYFVPDQENSAPCTFCDFLKVDFGVYILYTGILVRNFVITS